MPEGPNDVHPSLMGPRLVVYEVAEVISRHIRPGSSAERVWG